MQKPECRNQNAKMQKSKTENRKQNAENVET